MIVCESSHGPMYEHALSTLYLAEVWGQMLFLLLFSVVCLLGAVKLFRWS